MSDSVSARWECVSVSWGVWVSWECENVNWVYGWVTGWTLTTRHHYPIVNRSQSNPTLYMTIKDVSLIALRKILHVNLKFGEIFTRWFIFWGGSLVGVIFLLTYSCRNNLHLLTKLLKNLVTARYSFQKQCSQPTTTHATYLRHTEVYDPSTCRTLPFHCWWQIAPNKSS